MIWNYNPTENDVSFENKAELGKSLTKHNGAFRTNFIEESEKMKSSEDLRIVLKQLAKEESARFSHGLKLKKDLRSSYFSHFVMEYGNERKVGMYFFNQKRHLSVKQVQSAERSILRLHLNGAKIIANKIGYPAKREMERINSYYEEPILNIERICSLKKRSEMNII